MQKHVEAVNAVLRKNEGVESDTSEVDRAEVWEGVQEESRPVNLEEEFIDVDKYTTVTIEAVDVSRDGLQRVADDLEGSEDGQGDACQEFSKDVSGTKVSRRDADGKRMLAKEELRHPKTKSKKKRFKYESKTDRKLTRFKERSKGKRQAKERKER